MRALQPPDWPRPRGYANGVAVPAGGTLVFVAGQIGWAADGYFWFQARTDDMIISSGYNISGAEVESALLEHPAVAECAVVASPDEERGHVVKAFVVLAAGVAGDDALAASLQAHVKARIAPYKYPRRIAFLDALPRTPTGKVQRTHLRAMNPAR